MRSFRVTASWLVSVMLLAATIGSWCQLTCPVLSDPHGTAALSCHEMQGDAPALVNVHDCGEHAGRAFTIEPASRVAHLAPALPPVPPVMDVVSTSVPRLLIAIVDTGPPLATRTPTVLRL